MLNFPREPASSKCVFIWGNVCGMLSKFSEEAGIARTVALLVGRVLSKNPKTAPTLLGGAALRRWRQEDQNFKVNLYYIASSRVTQLHETMSQKREGEGERWGEGKERRRGEGRGEEKERKERQDSPWNTDSEGEGSMPCICRREKD